MSARFSLRSARCLRATPLSRLRLRPRRELLLPERLGLRLDKSHHVGSNRLVGLMALKLVCSLCRACRQRGTGRRSRPWVRSDGVGSSQLRPSRQSQQRRDPTAWLRDPRSECVPTTWTDPMVRPAIGRPFTAHRHERADRGMFVRSVQADFLKRFARCRNDWGRLVCASSASRSCSSPRAGTPCSSHLSARSAQ